MRGSELLGAAAGDPLTGCWLWQGYLTPDGYGLVNFHGRTERAHRVAYRAMVGLIPDGLVVDHVCFRPACINPAHLQLLTRSENARRQRAALENRCARGHWLGDGGAYINPHDGGRRCRVCARAAYLRRYAAPRARSERLCPMSSSALTTRARTTTPP